MINGTRRACLCIVFVRHVRTPMDHRETETALHIRWFRKKTNVCRKKQKTADVSTGPGKRKTKTASPIPGAALHLARILLQPVRCRGWISIPTVEDRCLSRKPLAHAYIHSKVLSVYQILRFSGENLPLTFLCLQF